MTASRSSLIVLFDGGCPICRRTVRTLQRLDWLEQLQFADATDDEIRRRVAPTLTLDEAMRQMNVVDGSGRLSGGGNPVRSRKERWPDRSVRRSTARLASSDARYPEGRC